MSCASRIFFILFFFNDTATTEIYTLSLHDALPIFREGDDVETAVGAGADVGRDAEVAADDEALALPHVELVGVRSEEHTSELQSRQYLVCRLLLEKKKNQQ